MSGDIEAPWLDRLRLAAGEHGVTLLRNNNGAMKTSAGGFLKFGLGASVSGSIGSSDLIGWFSFGGSAYFCAIEMKREGWQKPTTATEKRQENFISQVKKQGGFACFCIGTDEGISDCIAQLVAYKNSRARQG